MIKDLPYFASILLLLIHLFSSGFVEEEIIRFLFEEMENGNNHKNLEEQASKKRFLYRRKDWQMDK